MVEVKKGNWWQRKTTGQKVSFIIGAIIFICSLVGFIVFSGLQPSTLNLQH